MLPLLTLLLQPCYANIRGDNCCGLLVAGQLVHSSDQLDWSKSGKCIIHAHPSASMFIVIHALVDHICSIESNHQTELATEFPDLAPPGRPADRTSEKKNDNVFFQRCERIRIIPYNVAEWQGDVVQVGPSRSFLTSKHTISHNSGILWWHH